MKQDYLAWQSTITPERHINSHTYLSGSNYVEKVRNHGKEVYPVSSSAKQSILWENHQPISPVFPSNKQRIQSFLVRESREVLKEDFSNGFYPDFSSLMNGTI